jgi:hypothetical protein
VALASGVPIRTLTKIKGGVTKNPDQATVQAILSGLVLLNPDNPDSIFEWRTIPNFVLAQALRGGALLDDMKYIRDIKSGHRALSDSERTTLLAAVHTYFVAHQDERERVVTASEAQAQVFVDGLRRTDAYTQRQQAWIGGQL